jgi:hypothetical protein
MIKEDHMKMLFMASVFLSTLALADNNQHSSAWTKTKHGINTAAEKIDSGTRSVIKKTKAKIKEEQQDRKRKSARKDM